MENVNLTFFIRFMEGLRFPSSPIIFKLLFLFGKHKRHWKEKPAKYLLSQYSISNPTSFTF